jgi:hypothetical protein
MFKFLTFTIIIFASNFLLSQSSNVFAQYKNSNTVENKKGGTGIEWEYGSTNLNYKNNVYTGKLIDEFILSFRLFPSEYDTHDETQSVNILKYRSFIFPINFVSARISPDSKNDGFGCKVFGLSSGFDYRNGYCYGVGSLSSIDLYHARGILLAVIGTENKDSLKELGSKTVKEFIDKFSGWTLNDNYEIGIKYTISERNSIFINYEAKLIYPNVMFWHWLIGRTIEESTLFLIDMYVDEIFKQTPSLIPVINFLLKGSLSYALYDLRSQKMNLPFESEPGFLMNHFKFGFSYTVGN